jgi:hypothetical protein
MRLLGVLGLWLAMEAGVNAQVAVTRADDRPAAVSAGGQVRQQYERFANEEWGAETPDGTGYWLQRYMLHLDASWLFFWRQQVDDGIYGIPGNVLRSGDGTRSRPVGQSPGVEADWQVTDHVSLTGNAALFTAGPFIQESGPARTIGFVAGWATYFF